MWVSAHGHIKKIAFLLETETETFAVMLLLSVPSRLARPFRAPQPKDNQQQASECFKALVSCIFY